MHMPFVSLPAELQGKKDQVTIMSLIGGGRLSARDKVMWRMKGYTGPIGTITPTGAIRVVEELDGHEMQAYLTDEDSQGVHQFAKWSRKQQARTPDAKQLPPNQPAWRDVWLLKTDANGDVVYDSERQPVVVDRLLNLRNRFLTQNPDWQPEAPQPPMRRARAGAAFEGQEGEEVAEEEEGEDQAALTDSESDEETDQQDEDNDEQEAPPTRRPGKEPAQGPSHDPATEPRPSEPRRARTRVAGDDGAGPSAKRQRPASPSPSPNPAAGTAMLSAVSRLEVIHARFFQLAECIDSKQAERVKTACQEVCQFVRRVAGTVNTLDEVSRGV